MSKGKNASRHLVTAALIAAAYVALTYISLALGVAYGPIQLRLSEALMVLPLFTPAAIPGLTIGCLLGNIASPFGLLDVILGTLATLLSALLVRFIGKHFIKKALIFSFLPPVILNAIIVSAEVVIFTESAAQITAFLLFAIQIALGEALVYIVMGIPLYFALKKYENMFFQ